VESRLSGEQISAEIRQALSRLDRTKYDSLGPDSAHQ
jgi:hypothetical protein